MADEKHTGRTAGIAVIAVVAAAFALYFGREVFVPVAFAFVLDVVFRPAVRAMGRVGVPAPVSAGAVVIGLVVAMVLVGNTLAGPVQVWLDRLPESFDAAE